MESYLTALHLDNCLAMQWLNQFGHDHVNTVSRALKNNLPDLLTFSNAIT